MHPKELKGGASVFPIPPQDHTEPIEQEILLDFQNLRLRRHQVREQAIWQKDSDEWVSFPRDEILVHNGANFKNYKPHESNLANAPEPDIFGTELTVYKARPRVIVFEVENNPLLYACGIIHTTLNFDPANLRPNLNPAAFRMQSENELDGHQCLVLRTVPDPSKRFFEFWVDADDYRIIRQVHGYGLNQEGELWVTTTMEWQDTDYGPLPLNWEIQRFEHFTKKASVYKMTLDEFEVNPAVTDADFDIDPPPGTRVYDETLPKEAQEYVVAAPGKPNLPVGEHILQEEQTQSRNWLLAGIVAVVLLLIGAVVVYRRRRTS